MSLIITNDFPKGRFAGVYGDRLYDNFQRDDVTNSYTSVGLTSSIVDGELYLTNGNNDFSRYIRWNNMQSGDLGATTQEQYTQKIRFTNETTGAVGIWLGTVSISQYMPISFQAFFNTSSGGSRGYVSVFINGSFISPASPTALSFTNGDTIELSLQRDYFNWTITASNITNPSTPAVKTYSQTPTSGNSIGNIGFFCIGNYNGQYNVESWQIQYPNYKDAKYAFMGHSIVQGFDNSTYTNRFADKVMSNISVNKFNYNIFASGGALTTEGIKNVKEVINFNPHTVILMYGTNEASVAVPTGTFAVNYNSLCNELRAAKKKIIHCLLPPSGVAGWYANVPDYNSIITSEGLTYGEIIADTYTPLLGAAPACNPAYYHADTIHPNSTGHSLIASEIQKYL